MKRAVITSARLLTDGLQERGERYRCAMVTATYRPDVDWAAGHITGLVRCVRAYLARQGHPARFEWVAELQKRGAVHYHMLLWLPRGVTLPKPDKRGWWPHGMTRIEWARWPVGYLAKYASKGGRDLEFPKGARLHGHGGLNAEERRELNWWMLPKWVRDTWGQEHEPKRIRGGYRSKLTGQVIKSAWRPVAGFPRGRLVMFERRPVDNRLNDMIESEDATIVEDQAQTEAQAPNVEELWRGESPSENAAHGAAMPVVRLHRESHPEMAGVRLTHLPGGSRSDDLSAHGYA